MRTIAITLVITLVALACLLLGGCTDSMSDVGGEVTVGWIDEDGFADVLRGHRGSVVLVDFWATWCVECVALLPHTVALHDRWADRGLVVISVSIDEPEDKAAVERFLARRGATLENYIGKYGGGAQSATAFGIDHGLPHLKLYDREGNLYKTFEPGSDADSAELRRRIARAVGKLLDRT